MAATGILFIHLSKPLMKATLMRLNSFSHQTIAEPKEIYTCLARHVIGLFVKTYNFMNVPNLLTTIMAF